MTNITTRLCCSVALVALLASSSYASTYTLKSDAKNRVEFHSKATLESFSGKAKQISASFEIDTSALAKSSGKVIVDLRSLDTGIDLRNKHMRENHLHTDSFPNAIFELDSVSGTGSLGAKSSLTIQGRMTIHGVTNPVSAPATLEKSGSGLQLKTEFPLKITSYGIARPEFLFLKLAEDVRIIVDLTVIPKPQ